MENNIIKMLSSVDLEMINLGYSILRKLHKSKWEKIIKKCQPKYYIYITEVKIHIYEEAAFAPKVIIFNNKIREDKENTKYNKQQQKLRLKHSK